MISNLLLNRMLTNRLMAQLNLRGKRGKAAFADTALCKIVIGKYCFIIKDRQQWWGREFRSSLSLDMDKLFPEAIIHILYVISLDR